MLRVTVQASAPVKLKIRFRDASMKYTVYVNKGKIKRHLTAKRLGRPAKLSRFLVALVRAVQFELKLQALV